MHWGAFCQSSFRWIYYYCSNESTRKETSKSYICALPGWFVKVGLPWVIEVCTIDESIKGAASLRRYGITFDGNIDVMYIFSKLVEKRLPKHCPMLCEKMVQLLWYSHAYLKRIRNYFYVTFSNEKLGFIPLYGHHAQLKF